MNFLSIIGVGGMISYFLYAWIALSYIQAGGMPENKNHRGGEVHGILMTFLI